MRTSQLSSPSELSSPCESAPSPCQVISLILGVQHCATCFQNALKPAMHKNACDCALKAIQKVSIVWNTSMKNRILHVKHHKLYAGYHHHCTFFHAWLSLCAQYQMLTSKFILQERVGVLACCSLGIMLNIPASILIPLPSLFIANRALFWTSTYIGLFVKALGKLLIINPATILINQAAPVSQKGAVNGASSTLGALSRAAGPALGGGVWGMLADVRFPLHQFVPFVLMAGGALLSRFALNFVPSHGK